MTSAGNTRVIGRRGEEAAADYLREAGYEIVARNVTAGGMEADILAQNATHFAFVEVKSRRMLPDSPDKFGRPARAVTAKKRNHMEIMARAYLKEHPEVLSSRSPRLDVVEVYLTPTLTVREIRHYPGNARPVFRRPDTPDDSLP